MKFSSTEEYGLRLLIQLAQNHSGEGLTIPEISDLEGLSSHQTAKILRILRMNGLVVAARGKKGGYALKEDPGNIIIGDILHILGGKLYDSDFCDKYSGTMLICNHFSDCTVKNLWGSAQTLIDTMMNKITLANIMDHNFVSDFSGNMQNLVKKL